MAFALLVIGVFLLVSSVRGTQDSLFGLIKKDFTGSGNFVYWFAAIMLVGALGYIPKLKTISVALLTLIVLVLVLKKGDPSGVGGGLFAQLTKGLQTTNQAGTSATATATNPIVPSAATPTFIPPLASILPITDTIQ